MINDSPLTSHLDGVYHTGGARSHSVIVLLDPQANSKMGVIITIHGEYWALLLSTTMSWIVRKMLVDITFPDLQTLKIKKKIMANIPRDW